MPTTLTDLLSAQGAMLAGFIEAHADWAEAIVFLVAFAEGLTLVGLVIPGIVVLTAAGGLAAAGVLDFWTILLAITAGAILGDAASYWLGRRYGERLFQLWPFSRRPGLRGRGEAFFEKHGGKSVFLARFLGPLRAVVPTTAGMMGMPHRQFQVFNVLSAVIWAPLLMSPGHVAWNEFGKGGAGDRAVPSAPSGGGEPAAPRTCVLAPPVEGVPPAPGC
ncbi:DedA family protein [Azospirillum sp. SYSU D00513]|uniref:DedA family protein n=1 Tax=Azospirillum sp. SYSU D00513 TaxID=2812561 RepID=UPI0032B60498